MKKTVSTILACIILVGSLLTLASCSKVLVGEYEDSLTGNVTYEFDIFGKVTMTVDNIIGDDTVKVGTYKISDAGDEITLTFDGESDTTSFAIGEENGEEYIKIGLFKYEKED